MYSCYLRLELQLSIIAPHVEQTLQCLRVAQAAVRNALYYITRCYIMNWTVLHVVHYELDCTTRGAL
jgi:hypothetical protein